MTGSRLDLYAVAFALLVFVVYAFTVLFVLVMS